MIKPLPHWLHFSLPSMFRDLSCRATRTIWLLAATTLMSTPAYTQSAGTLDPTWSPALTADMTVQATALQPDGKLIIAGVHPLPRLMLKRVTATGALDTEFGDAGTGVAVLQKWPQASISEIIAESSTSMVVAGFFSNHDEATGITRSGVRVGRYDSGGFPNPLFGAGNPVEIPLSPANSFGTTIASFAQPKLVSQPDGKVLLLVSTLEAFSDTARRNVLLIRLNADGTLDPTFGTGGVFLTNGRANDFALDYYGSIFIAADGEENAAGFVMKLTPAGVPDSTFGTAGKVMLRTTDAKVSARAIAIQDAFRIVVGGSSHNAPELRKPNGILLMRLKPDGSLDTAFADGGYFFRDLPGGTSPYSDAITRLAIEPSGKIVAAADKNTRGPSVGDPVLMRFQQDGQLDPKFGTEGIFNPPGWLTADLEVGNAAYLLVSDRSMFGGPPTLLKVVTRTDTAAPIINAGGNKVIPDTDGVPGEIVNLAATASDSDGRIVNTRWFVDGAEVTWPVSFMHQIINSTFQISMSPLLSDGTHDVTFVAMDNDGAESRVSLSYDVSAPVFPLPRTSSLTSSLQFSPAQFAFAARDAAGTRMTSANLSQALNLTGYIFPAPSDSLATADIFVFVETPFGWFMRDAMGRFLRWDMNHATLVPAYEKQQLTDPFRVYVYSGLLPWSGRYRIHLGYRRTGSNELIYAVESATLDIEP